jgi:hypothetical protein
VIVGYRPVLYRTRNGRKADIIMGRSRAIGGMTPGKWLSPFYDTGRRFLGCSPETLDSLVAVGAVAEMRASNTVAFVSPMGQVMHQATYRGYHRGKITKWVNRYNGRSVQAGTQARR